MTVHTLEPWLERFFEDAARPRAMAPFEPLVVLVGGNAMREFVRDEIHRREGGRLGLYALTFVDLARRLALADDTRPTASPAFRRALLARLLSERDGGYFDRVRDFDGTPGVFLDLFDDLIESGWENIPTGKTETEKVTDIARLYRRFREELAAVGRRDPGSLWREALAGADRFPAVFGTRTLRVLGVYDANPVQRALLAAVARAATVAYFVPPVPEPSSWAVAVAGSALDAKRVEPWSLRDGDEVWSCAGRSDEVRRITRGILKRRGEGVAFHRMAVLLRHREPYAERFADAFARAGIPLRLFGGRAPVASTVPRALRALVTLLENRDASGRPILGRGDVLTLLGAIPWRADASAPAGVRERWPDLTRRLVIRRGEDWEAALAGPAEADPAAGFAIGELGEEFRAADCRAAAILRAVVARLRAVLEAVTSAGSYAAASGALADWVEADFEPDEYVATWAASVRALAEIDDAGTRYSPDFFTARVAEAIDALRDHSAGRDRDGVRVLDMAQARGPVFDVVFIPGCAEGALPHIGCEDPLLQDEDRARLNRARPDAPLPTFADRPSNERNLFDLALRAGARRVLTFPRRDDSLARPSAPSHYVIECLGEGATLDDLNRHDRVRVFSGASVETGAWYLDDGERASAIASSLGDRVDAAATFMARVHTPFERVWARRRRRFSNGLTADDGLCSASEAARTLSAWSDRRDSWSVTALESFGLCPRRYLYKRILRAERPDDPEAVVAPGADLRGSIVHAALAWRASEAGSDEGLNEFVEARVRALGSVRLTGAPVLNEIERERVLAITRALWALGEGEADRRVVHTETSLSELIAEIGSPDFRPALPLSGRVDRLDADGAGGWTLVDYKTGRAANSLSGKSLHADSLNQGSGLQLALYARALRAARPGLRVATEYRYWKNEKGEENPNRVAVSDEAQAGLDATIDAFVEGALADIRAGRFVPRRDVAANEDSPICRYCDFRKICDGWSRRRVADRAADGAEDAEPAWLAELGRIGDDEDA